MHQGSQSFSHLWEECFMQSKEQMQRSSDEKVPESFKKQQESRPMFLENSKQGRKWQKVNWSKPDNSVHYSLQEGLAVSLKCSGKLLGRFGQGNDMTPTYILRNYYGGYMEHKLSEGGSGVRKTKVCLLSATHKKISLDACQHLSIMASCTFKVL